MLKTHGVALHPGIGHSRGIFSCLRMATASFNGTTHGHVLLNLLRFSYALPLTHFSPHVFLTP